MAENKPRAGPAENLRRRAEKKATINPSQQQEALLPEQAQNLLLELRVHQIELEMQNEELRHAQAELEDSRARYFDLYDLAPVGYFTLSKQGVILESNLTAAKLLGVKRGYLARRPLTHFIHLADDDIYNEHCKRLFKTGKPQVFELRLIKHDCSQFWARLEASVAKGVDDGPVCRVVIINITDRKLAEEALQQAYNETEEKVERRTRELQRANRALLMLKEGDEARLRACSEAELLDQVCRIVVEIGKASLAWVGFPEQDKEKTVRPVAGAGKVDAYLKKVQITWANNKTGRGPVGAAIRKGLVSVCRDAQCDPYLAPDYAASIALPLIGESRCFGVLSIYSAQAEAFNDDEVTLLKHLADDLAFGIIALRTRAERERLQQEVLKISEREKQLVAQELHDNLCQHLVGTAMMGGLLARRLAEKGDPEATQAKAICDLLNTGVDEARNLSLGLHPIKFGGEGLAEALFQYAATATKLFAIRCSFRCGESVAIENQVVATHFFRIAQEAVNNAVKHGEASRILITLNRYSAGIALSIRDNGIGIPRDLPPSHGMGIRIMQHRADSIGAALKISRGTLRGTVVRCSVLSSCISGK